MYSISWFDTKSDVQTQRNYRTNYGDNK